MSNNISDRMDSTAIPMALDTAHYGRWAQRCGGGGGHSVLSPLIVVAYRFRALRRLCIGLARHMECGEMHSITLRRLLQVYHGVTVGRYSYGSCLVPGVLPPGSSVGNYCSSAEGLHVFRRNHPIDFLSQHPFFYNSDLGLLARDTIEQIEDNPLTIGNDVWIGNGVTILPGCRSIGDGAIVGAGSVLTRDIPPFTVYAGNPAKLIRERFSPEICELIKKTKWWTLSLSKLVVAGDLLVNPVTLSKLEGFLSRLEHSNAKSP